MQNSPELDFKKILDQTLYTYVTEKHSIKDIVNESPPCTGNVKPWPSMKHGLVRRLWPIVVLIGGLEVLVGVALLIFIVISASDYDVMYATEDTKMISLMSFGGLITLVINGMMLLTSLMLEKRRIMWFYILTSSFLCVYIFVLSVMKIHFALLVLGRDTYKLFIPENRHFLLSTACVVGIVTMLGSVIHFIGTVTVFIYYNLKYIQPILFNYGPSIVPSL